MIVFAVLGAIALGVVVDCYERRERRRAEAFEAEREAERFMAEVRRQP